MTSSLADRALPEFLRQVDQNRLRELDRADAVAALTGPLCELYLLASGLDDEDDDAEVDPGAPLFLESLVAARLNAAFEAWLGVTVPVSALMQEAPSIAELSGKLVDALHADGGVRPSGPVLVADPAARYEPFPLAEIQQAYWIGRDPVYELGNVVAHLYVELRVTGFDVQRAERALQRLIDHHDMLRSVVTRDGRQRVLPDVPPYRIEVVDLGGDRAQLDTERDAMLRRELRADDWRPLEVRLARLPGDRAQLMLLFNMVKLDAWSAQLLLTDWFELYDDPDRELPAVELSFRDYVLWAGEVQRSEAYQRAREYWLRRIPTLPQPPELPLAKPLEAVAAPRFTPRSVRLEEPAWTALKARAERANLTPSTLLCAAYAEVVGTWSRRQRFTLSVSAGRPAAHPEIGRIIGSFARPTLLEVDGMVPGGFEARAQVVARQLAADSDHREYGGLELLRELARTRGRTRAANPVIFTSTLPQAGEGGLTRPAWADDQRHVVWGMPQLLLENQVQELDGALVITWVSVDEAFAGGVVDEMFDAYLALLRGLATDDQAWTRPRPLLPPEQAARREAVNRTEAPVPDGLLHSRFAEQVALRGAEPAVISPRRTVSYAELDRHAEHVAARLRERAVRPNTLVAVCMERGWEQVAAVLGILRAGAAYLPLDPELPTARLHWLLANAEVEHVLTQPWVGERLCWPDGVHRIPVGDDVESPHSGRHEVAASPDDLAYVIFTSGSTGQPKGVMIDHRGALNTVLDVNRRFGVGPADRVLALSALSFDLSVYDVFGPLSAGGAIVLPDPARAKDPAHWSELMRRERVTLWNSVPALMEMFVEHGDAAVDTLRLVLLSGDWIATSLPGRIAKANPGAEVISLGGATEASIWSIMHPAAETEPGARSVPYGRPMDNQRFHVLNQRLEPCPELVPGELYIAGIGLARGYWRDEQKTSASFFAHPVTGERLYRTGDLGRYLRDCTIEFLGREDAQVKVNGYRIELGEIEAALESHPAVRSAVAVANGERDGARWLSAFVVPADGASPGDAALRAFLAERLPEYAVPARIVELDRLPLTANGKVDRAALPSPGETSADGTATPAAPSTPVERLVAELWSQVLDRQQVGVDESFFALGGTSLHAVQFATRAQDAGLRLTAADVLRHQTVRELASVATVAGEPDRKDPS